MRLGMPSAHQARPDQARQVEPKRVASSCSAFKRANTFNYASWGRPPIHTYQRAPQRSPALASPLPTPASLAPYKGEPSKRHFKFRGGKNIKRWDKTFSFPFFCIHFGWGYYECESKYIYICYIYIFLTSKIVNKINLVFSN